MTKQLNRRKLLKTAALGTVAAAAGGGFAAPAIASGKRQWKMAMTYQKELPGLGKGAVRLAKRITDMSGGALEIKPYGGGELVPPFGVFDGVAQGTAEMGFSASYYWLSKNKSCAFFTAVPGGMTAFEMNGWLYFGGGIKLWHELYSQFGLIAFPAGQTGCQMGGWFNKKLNRPEDLKGLKMRMPGLGGEVFARLGGNPQNIPPQELFTSLQSGVIDGLEWVGPWNDMALGFHKIAKYYYGPGFHEGSATLELMLNKKAWDSLPKELQRIIKIACATENSLMHAEYQANNAAGFAQLQKEGKVEIRPYPNAVLKAFFDMSKQVQAETAAAGALEKKIYESYHNFQKQNMAMGDVTERAFMNGRAL